ncbi:hypothetical protein HGT73_05375 [Rosenbergiella australiborealis]|uniref:Uncharacterized protein n=1 Tax=Rosenbergiella australiborealis TaxID=1544696 RepID=A0ABS5T377_9GAMM|nr:hypothetical protein [Rosenbergiella australiborealis]MBT0726818.1 hypothetical protein [Rosenbergiella australiborealis]
MPVYASPDQIANGFMPSGSALPEAEGFDVSLPEGVNPQPAAQKPSVWNAAFNQNNVLSGLFRSAPQFEPQEGYNPFQDKLDIQGYETWATQFVHSSSPEETAWIKQQIDDENEDRQVLAEAGGIGLLASIAAGAIDPITLASMAIPVAKGGMLARVGSQMVSGVEGSALSELALNQQQQTRTLNESAAHIASAALMSTVFATAGHFISPQVKSAVTQEVADALETVSERASPDDAAHLLPRGGSVGAAKIEQATLEDLTLANNSHLSKLAYKAGRSLTPIARLMDSPSLTTRRTALELAENNFTLQGNARGIATPVAAETRVRGWRREEAAVVVTNKQAYTKYKSAGGDKSFSEFREEVGNAMRQNDVHSNPAVAETAQAMRQVVNRVKVEQQKLGLLPPDEELKAIGQESYFPRVYKVGKIINERDKFREMLVDWWSRGEQTLSREEAELSADATINKIVGAKVPQDFTTVFMVKSPSSTKSRTLSVPDRLMKDYLESDVNYVLQRHIREAASDIELTRSFGDKSLKTRVDDINAEYDALMRERPQDQAKLSKARDNDVRDIMALRDRLEGTYKMPDDPNSFFVRAGAFMRSANFVTKLGGMTVSAIPDLARGVMMNGFQKVTRGYATMITRSPAWKASRAEQKKMAVGLETILQSRARTMADLVDSSARTSAVEAGIERVTDVFGKLTLMGQFDDINKSVNGMITSDGILSGTFATRRLAKLGINENMAQRIRQEFTQHGEVIEGWHIGNFEKWGDQHVASVFQAAVLKDVNNTVITPGIGDTPLWASSAMGKTIFQFKSFTTASYNRATLGGLQEGTAQFYYGTALQIGLGALTYALKEAAKGKEIDWSPEKLVAEGIDRSGVLGPLMEYNNIAEKASWGTVGMGALLGTSTQSRYASRGLVGSIAGPTFGLTDSVVDVTGGILNGDMGDRVLHNFRTLLPGNNLFWIAPLVNQVDPGVR